jgi:hypothetical protein
MSKKINILVKRKWLDMFEQGKTEVQIAREEKRDPRTITKGIEEVAKAGRLASAEAEMLRGALLRHQDQLINVLKGISTMLVPPPYNLELREEKDGLLAPIPLSGARLDHISEEQMTLKIHDEDKLEWGLLQEHLKKDKLWVALRKWRRDLIGHVQAVWQFKQEVKAQLEKETGMKFRQYKDDERPEYLLPETADLLFKVGINKILGIPDGTDLENNLFDRDDGFVRHGPGGTKLAKCKNTKICKKKIAIVITSLPSVIKALVVKRTHRELADIIKSAKGQADEILLLGMITGKCRVCRRLGK